jgi:membrane protein YqaA with SNARE-associated domain
MDHALLAALALDASRNVRHWIYQLGGLGLIPLGLLDNSVIPVPGSMDVLTIVLAAHHQTWWPYYAAMAVLGSLIGGFLTYRLARKGGKEALEKRFPQKRLKKVYSIFERWGFGAVAIPAILPPPVPTTAFLLAAGALQYPVRKYLAALFLGRAARYALLAFLGARYGAQILKFFTQQLHPAALITLAAVAIATLVILYFVLGKKQKRKKPQHGKV